jgi:hypothetical protein
MKSRTPSDFAIVAIFQDKRKPQNAAQSAFPLDFMGIFDDVATLCAFCKEACAVLDPCWRSGTNEICPYFLLCRGFIRRMKPAALVDRL